MAIDNQLGLYDVLFMSHCGILHLEQPKEKLKTI